MDEKESSLEYACAHGQLDKLLEEYIISCSDACELESAAGKKCSKKSKKKFPNVAGFCRYFHIGDAEYEQLCRKYPTEFERVKLVFEDEALNSEISPTILSAYLKKRLGYEKSSGGEVYDGQLKVVFDHDILEDGK